MEVNYNQLNSVIAISATDIWAVASAGSNNTYQTLTEHWNGTQWSIVKNPVVIDGLRSVSASSINNVWTVGGINANETLAEHWNGRRWKQVESPSPFYTNVLIDATVITSKNAWAVGESDRVALIEHWNGKTWNTVPSPALETASGSGPGGVTQVPGTTQLWAAGSYLDANGNYYTLVESYC